MTSALNINRNGDGQFEITDASGKAVEGPFDTNAAAWKALDRLDNQDAATAEKRRSNKRVLWGKPKKSKSRKQRKQEKRMKRDAHKAVGWVRDIAANSFDPAGERSYRDYKLGTFGAASDVKRIDPAVYLAEKAAQASGERK